MGPEWRWSSSQASRSRDTTAVMSDHMFLCCTEQVCEEKRLLDRRRWKNKDTAKLEIKNTTLRYQMLESNEIRFTAFLDKRSDGGGRTKKQQTAGDGLAVHVQAHPSEV